MPMPSVTVGTPNTCGIAPAAFSASIARSTSGWMPALHGIHRAVAVGDADDRLVEIVVAEADGAQHRAVGRAGDAVGDESASGDCSPRWDSFGGDGDCGWRVTRAALRVATIASARRQTTQDRAAGDEREARRVERVQALADEQRREDRREHRHEVREDARLHGADACDAVAEQQHRDERRQRAEVEDADQRRADGIAARRCTASPSRAREREQRGRARARGEHERRERQRHRARSRELASCRTPTRTCRPAAAGRDALKSSEQRARRRSPRATITQRRRSPRARGRPTRAGRGRRRVKTARAIATISTGIAELSRPRLIAVVPLRPR